MEYARWTSRLSRTDKDGKSQRAHLELLAKRGNPDAIAALTPPPFPDELEALWEQFKRLDSMREYDMNGPRRFTPIHIQAAAALFDWHLQPHEVEALAALDVVTLFPDAVHEDGE